MKTENTQITKENRLSIGCLFEMEFLTIELLKSLKNSFKISFIEIEDVQVKASQSKLDFILADASQLQTLATYNKQELWNSINISLFLLLKKDETISVDMLMHPLVNKTIIVENNNYDFGNTVKNAFQTIQEEYKAQASKILFTNKKTEKTIAIFLENVHTAIKENSETNHISTTEIAAALCMSSVTLRRKIKKHTGMTAVQYILQYRLQMAKFFLTIEGCNVQETAMKTGFMSNSYFTKSFKNIFGVSPSNYIIN